MNPRFEPDKKYTLVNLNLLIVEDSLSYSIELEQLADEVGFNVIGTVDNSADALDIIFSRSPDVILMDIDIKGRLTGIDIAKKIHHLNIPVLYITSFGDEATYKQALESNLVGYIVKPVDKLTLATSLKLLIKNALVQHSFTHTPELYIKDEEEFIFFMKNNVYQKVNINEIVYIKSDDNYCHFFFDDETTFLLRIKIGEAEELLQHRKFIRCHRQYIVNQMKIKSLDTQMSTLEVGNEKIPYSRSKKQEIMSIGIFLR